MQTSVNFKTDNALLQKLMNQAEEKSLNNIRNFQGHQVLVEGGGYEKIWLETQPMGGAMYAKRNLQAALNNQLMFMQYQREDGRIPGSIALIDGKVIPQFNKFQGFCFPDPALDMYYFMGQDPEYLDLLYKTLASFDKYLWRTHDSDGDGCLESWCRYDTGEDHALRYGDAPDAWESEEAPVGKNVVPMASMDVMSYSYSARSVIAEICRIKKKKTDYHKWALSATDVSNKISTYLWRNSCGGLFDRDNKHQFVNVLSHNTLRAMYWHSISDEMAACFVKEHLLNPVEFWTKMPLSSVSVSDPLFANVSTNDWSGQCEALTYQRAIRALENYQFYSLIPQLGNKLFEAIGENCCFVQQYDPFTMKPSLVSLEEEQDAYGPAMLSVMEYIARMYGADFVRGNILWGTTAGINAEYEQIFGDHSFRLILSGEKAYGYIDGDEKFESGRNLRILTDMNGNLISVEAYAPDADCNNFRRKKYDL